MISKKSFWLRTNVAEFPTMGVNVSIIASIFSTVSIAINLFGSRESSYKESHKNSALAPVKNIDSIIDTLTPIVGDTATLVRSQKDFLEIIAPHVSKGDALYQLAQQYGIGLEHIVSFGNAENDISMLSKTGYSVAVENAVDHVKSVACEVCGHHNEDGVAHWIEEHLL